MAQDRAAMCQLRPPTHCRLSLGAHASAPLRSLSLQTRQSTHACDARARCRAARARCRAGCSRFTHDTRTLHQREASLLRRKTEVRRASCGLQHIEGFSLARMRASHCARCLSRGGEALALTTRARRAGPIAVTSCTMQGHCIGERHLSSSAQDRAAMCQLRPPTHSRISVGAHASAPLRSLFIETRRSTLACDARKPCRAGRPLARPTRPPLVPPTRRRPSTRPPPVPRPHPTVQCHDRPKFL